jgi:hypothetical protein
LLPLQLPDCCRHAGCRRAPKQPLAKSSPRLACPAHPHNSTLGEPFKSGQQVFDVKLVRGSIPRWKVNSLEEWLARTEALLGQGPGLADDIAALLALQGLGRSAADQAAPETLSRAAGALVALAEHAAAARSPADDAQCHVCRTAFLLGSVLQKCKPLAVAAQRHAGLRGAVVAVLDTVEREDVTYKNEVMILQAASAQVYLGRACPGFWRRMHGESRFGRLVARTGSYMLWARARLFSAELMAQPSKGEWAELCSFLPTVAKVMTGHDLSNTLWAGATIGHGYQGDLAELLLAAIQRLSQNVEEAQPVSTIIWAVGRMRWDGRREELQSLYTAIRRVHTDFVPHDASQLLGGLAALGVSVPTEDREALFAAISRLSTRLRAQDVANIVFYLGRLPWSVPDNVMRDLLDVVRRHEMDFRYPHLPQLLLGFAWLSDPSRESVTVPADVQALLLRVLDRQMPHQAGPYVSDCLKALGMLLWPLPETLAAKLVQRYTAEDTQRQLRLLNVSDAVVGLARLCSVISSDLLATAHAATCAAVARVAAGWHADIMSDCVRALGQLRWRLTPEVISALRVWVCKRAEELQPAQLVWLLLGLANSRSPLGAEAMARLLGQVDDKLALPDNASATLPSSQPGLVAACLHALTELSAQGTVIAPATVTGLVRHAALLELKPIQTQQVRTSQHCITAAQQHVWGALVVMACC